MQYVVIAKTRASQTGVKVVDDHTFQVSVSAAPEKGRANAAIIKELARHLRVAPSRLKNYPRPKQQEKIFRVHLVLIE